jgi:hypothetical protein
MLPIGGFVISRPMILTNPATMKQNAIQAQGDPCCIR